MSQIRVCTFDLHAPNTDKCLGWRNNKDMPWTRPDDDAEIQLLNTVKSIAVVGVSDKPGRASYDVSKYLLDHTSYDMWFVNPRIESVFGKQVYPSLRELPVVPDLAVIFRRAEDLPEVLADVTEAGIQRIWIQLGIVNMEVADDAVAAGIDVVMDACILVEHKRLIA